MKLLLKIGGLFGLLLLTAQTCTVAPGPIVGPGPIVAPRPVPVFRQAACFRNPRNYWRYYRVEWRDGSGRFRVFSMRPFQSRRRVHIGRGSAVWCWARRPGLVTNLRCQRPLRVIKNC